MRTRGDDIPNVWQLFKAGDVAALADALASSDRSSDDRFLAARFLGKLEARSVVDQLRLALTDEDQDVRIAVVRALGSLLALSAADDLLGIARDPGESQPIREWALDALTTLHDSRAAPQLEKFLQHPDKHRRRWAATELGRLGEPRVVDALRRAQAADDILHRHVYGRAIRLCQGH